MCWKRNKQEPASILERKHGTETETGRLAGVKRMRGNFLRE
jgi:hypothetical protein